MNEPRKKRAWRTNERIAFCMGVAATAALGVILIAALFVGAAITGNTVNAGAAGAAGTAGAAGAAGTNSDPIALKSYVDSQTAAISKRVDALTTENAGLKSALQSYADALAAEAEAEASNPDAPATDGGSGGSGASFVVLQVEAGQRMLMGAGTELVLRTGSAQAIRGEFGCVADLISGKDLEGEDAVVINHLLVSSRDDNRGVRFTEAAYLLIKGDYSLR